MAYGIFVLQLLTVSGSTVIDQLKLNIASKARARLPSRLCNVAQRTRTYPEHTTTGLERGQNEVECGLCFCCHSGTRSSSKLARKLLLFLLFAFQCSLSLSHFIPRLIRAALIFKSLFTHHPRSLNRNQFESHGLDVLLGIVKLRLALREIIPSSRTSWRTAFNPLRVLRMIPWHLSWNQIAIILTPTFLVAFEWKYVRSFTLFETQMKLYPMRNFCHWEIVAENSRIYHHVFGYGVSSIYNSFTPLVGIN